MNTGYYVGSFVGGMVMGAVGAYVAESSTSHPILKGALVVGAANVVLSAALAVGYQAREKQLSTTGTAGLGAHPMFP